MLVRTVSMGDIWSRLEGRVPVNRLAKTVTKRAHIDDMPPPESDKEKIKRLELENLRLQQEIDWYLSSQLGWADFVMDLIKELRPDLCSRDNEPGDA